MKRSKFNVLGLLLLLLSVVVLVGCKKPVDDETTTELNMAVFHNSKATTITFEDDKIVGEGLTLADGNTYVLGDLKPVWAELQTILDVKFNNVCKFSSDANNEFIAWQELGFEGVDVVVGNADKIAEAGRQGQMIDLGAHLDEMPNFKNFLEENPIVYLSVLSDVEKGSIYYAPYFDGYDDIEKYFLMRTDWIEDLLDGESAFTATTSDTVGDIIGEVAYTPYMPTSGTVVIESLTQDGTDTQDITKNYETTYGNIVEYMNENVTASTTGVELVNMLRGYIDAAYNGLYGNERSRLFTGYDAAWDADELVALLRCVVLNTQTLTGQNEVKVTGIFPREAKLQRISDLLSLSSLFGVRGYESRNNYLYFDKDGNLCDARADEEYAAAINKLNQLYQEGLILQNFDTYEGTIYKDMYQKNQGFMLYDYVQTQSLYNADETALAVDSDFNLTAVMTPVANWNDGTGAKYMRFTESWRSVKTNGWCIPSTISEDKLDAALKLFDYMYSEEGNILMSFGPSAWRSGKTITYKGEQVPEMSEAALDELWNLGKGNYTNYARQYLGSTLPVGFVKNQAMEYQCTTVGGQTGAGKVSAGIATGTVKHVTPEISSNLWYTMVPTVLPTTAEQDSTIKSYAAISDAGLYSKSNNKYNIFVDVIKYGFGSGQALSNSNMATMPATASELSTFFTGTVAGGTVYLGFQQAAWNTLKAYYDEEIAK